MKSAEITVGDEYVVALKTKHVLIPDTDTTYVERLEWFDSLPKEMLDRLPHAAVSEHRRLREAVGNGVGSRISRCRAVFGPDLRDKHTVSRRGILAGRCVGVICTVVEKDLGVITVKADFVEQVGGLFEGETCATAFDPSIPEDIDVVEIDSDEGMTDEEAEAENDAIDALLRDGAGTLRARVHPQAIRYLYDDDLLDRLDAKEEEANKRSQVERKRRWRELAERHAPELIDRAIDRILRDADRPADDDWQALA